MIHDEEGLRRTRQAVGKLESILASLEQDKDKIHPDRYAIMVEAPQEQLAELQAEIDQYLATARPAGPKSTPEVPLTPQHSL